MNRNNRHLQPKKTQTKSPSKPYVPLTSIYEQLKPLVTPQSTLPVDLSTDYLSILEMMTAEEITLALKNKPINTSEARALFERLQPHQRRALLEERALHEYSANADANTGGYDGGGPKAVYTGLPTLLNGLLHYWSFDDTIDLATNQLWYSPKVAGSPYLRHRSTASDDPDDPSATLNGDILNFGISQGILGNAAYGNVRTQVSGQPAVNNTNCVFTTANNSTTPVNIAALGSVFTINWWMKFDNTKEGYDSCIIRKRIRALANDNYLTINTNYLGNVVEFSSPALINTGFQNESVLANVGFSNLYDNVWRMYSLVCDGSVASFAINADLSSGAEYEVNTATIIDVVDPLALPLNINYDMKNFEPTPLDSSNVYIDEFGIWDRALTNSELLELYNNGLGKAYPFS